MATVHMICGFLGAGKTTFSKRLANELGAVRFSVDELYLRLFADGPTYDLDQRALDRLLGALDELWPEVARAGADVVLDFGFWSRTLREQVRTRALAMGASPKLYWIRCSDDVALSRCLARNGSKDAFLISATGYTELKARFEAPEHTESHERIET